MVSSICFTFSSRLDVVSYKTLDVSILFPIYIYIYIYIILFCYPNMVVENSLLSFKLIT
jgi:hypothetical protein